MKFDHVDRQIVRLLGEDGRATYSEISKEIGVSVGTVRNRISALRESGALHLNVWLDPTKIGLGVSTTFLLKVEANLLEEVIDALTMIDSVGYLAVIAGDHDVMADVFCRDVAHLNVVMRDEIRTIEGIASITSYLVTEVRYDSNANIVDLLGGDTPQADALDGGR